MGQNSWVSEVIAKGMLALHPSKQNSCHVRIATFLLTGISTNMHAYLFLIFHSQTLNKQSNVREILVSQFRNGLICDLSDFCTVCSYWCSKIFK
jgi:hypothetical protein